MLNEVCNLQLVDSMAGIPSGTQGQAEYRYLIDFVKAGQGAKREKKQNPVPQSSISGDEARLFYEEICQKNVVDETITDQNLEKTSDSAQSKRHRKRTQCRDRSTKRKHSGNHKSDQCDVGSSGMSSVDQQCDSKGSKKVCDLQSRKKRLTESSTKYNTSKERSHTGSQRQLNQRVLDHRKSEFLRLAQNGDSEGVKSLLQQGVDVNSIDRFGWTASMAAAFEGHLGVLETLLESGADLTLVSSHGQTALTLAHQKHHTSVVKFIESYQKFGFIESRFRKKAEKQTVNFYCDVCKAEFSDTDQKTHSTSVVHIFNSGVKPKDDSFLIPLSNTGFRMMMKSGWDGNTGLGPSGQGQKFPVKTLLKRDRKGLGSEITDKAKVTHFKAKDNSAVATVLSAGYKREANVRTLSRRAQRAKERRDRRWEINLRRELS